MRKIEIEELRPVRVGKDQYMKSVLCDYGDSIFGCFIKEGTRVITHCERFVWHHDGFKCNRKW